MKISIKIKRQARKENPHHNCSSLNLFLIQLESLLAAVDEKSKKGKKAAEIKQTLWR
jgi:hypothetical protein